MPVRIRQTKPGHFRVSTPNGVHAKDTTKPNAERQARLLRAVDHGWHPTGRHARESIVTAQAKVLVNEMLAECRDNPRKKHGSTALQNHANITRL